MKKRAIPSSNNDNDGPLLKKYKIDINNVNNHHIKEAVKKAVFKTIEKGGDSIDVNASDQPIIFNILHNYADSVLTEWLAYWPRSQKIGEQVLMTLKYIHDMGNYDDDCVADHICIIEYFYGDYQYEQNAKKLLLKYFKTDELFSLGMFRKVDLSCQNMSHNPGVVSYHGSANTVDRSILNTFLYIQECYGYI